MQKVCTIYVLGAFAFFIFDSEIILYFYGSKIDSFLIRWKSFTFSSFMHVDKIPGKMRVRCNFTLFLDIIIIVLVGKKLVLEALSAVFWNVGIVKHVNSWQSRWIRAYANIVMLQ